MQMEKEKTLCIDFGGTTIKLAVVEYGKILRRSSIPAWSENGLQPRLEATREAAFQLTEGNFQEFCGVGVAMPGLVNPVAKCVTEIYKKYEDAKTLNLAQWCEEVFGLPMVMEQDSKAALLGEVRYGCAQGYENAILITLGTGVGTAVMIHGQILNSRNHFAGSLGSHIIVNYHNGRQCTCGNRGCLEAYAASYALPQMICEHPRYAESGLYREEYKNYRTLKKWYMQGDPVAKDVLLEIVEALQAGIISLVHCYDPDIVILSGGAMNFGPEFIEPIVHNLNHHLWGAAQVRFSISQTPDDSVLMGLDSMVRRSTGR